MSTIPYHKPGVTYNGLHATTNPTVDQVTADLATTKLHFELMRPHTRNTAVVPWMWERSRRMST